jgi:primosomal protein N' (replication factor Y)
MCANIEDFLGLLPAPGTLPCLPGTLDCGMLVSVAVGLPRLPLLTYQHPNPIEPGSRVLVPLGKRVVTGMVVDADPQPPTNERGMLIKQVAEVLDDAPSMPPVVMELARRVADYYLCSWGEVLFAALPSGLAPSSVVRVELLRPVSPTELEVLAKHAPRRAALLQVLQEHQGDLTVQYLQKVLRTTTVADQLDALQRAGMVDVRTVTDEETQPRHIRAVRLAPHLAAEDADVRSVFDELDRRAPKQSLALGQLFLAHMRGDGPQPITQLARETGSSAAAIEALVGKGLATLESIIRPPDDAPFDALLVSRDEAALTLTPEQSAAVMTITGAMPPSPAHAYAPYLLEGVTGSGKTVVYQRVMQEVLDRGQTCLMLVPEIALTPQLHDRFRAVFGERVALMHSRMSMGDRVGTWQRIKRGELPVVIGARSAVFAPLRNVGLIVVDEEHEPSYKQDDPAPRYHGRDVAIMRAAFEQCAVILGSATPSLESVHNARTGRYTHLALTHRTDGASMPTLSVVNIAAEKEAGRMKGTLSSHLIDAVLQRTERHEGSILFLNRRGFASQLTCQDCGHVATCPNCDVHLTWHKKPGHLRCHYCGHTEAVRTACTECGSTDLRDGGIGTQRVEEELTSETGNRKPETKPETGQLRTANGNRPVIARMDADTMQKRNAHRKLLEKFAGGEVDVIVGTQMVAKGLDIARVTLVAVVLADQALHQSDFRAAERTVQLLVQVAGRAGRTAKRPGEVIIQTFAPSHPAIQAVVDQRVTEWMDTELQLRKEAGYPPYSRFMVLELSGPDEGELDHAARVLDRLLPTDDPAIVRFAPVAPSVAWVRNRHRRIIVIKNPKDVDPSGARARTLISAALNTYYESYASASVRVSIDVDASGQL